MSEMFKTVLDAISGQYGAAFAMLKKDIKNCPDDVWDDRANGPPFWHVVYHVMWFVDWYLSNSKEARENFKPNLGDENLRDLNTPPNITLNRDEILIYLSDIKSKAKNRFENLTEEQLNDPSLFEWHGNNLLGSLIYNLRHLMLHIGALNLRLHSKNVKIDNWVSYKRI